MASITPTTTTPLADTIDTTTHGETIRHLNHLRLASRIAAYVLLATVVMSIVLTALSLFQYAPAFAGLYMFAGSCALLAVLYILARSMQTVAHKGNCTLQAYQKFLETSQPA